MEKMMRTTRIVSIIAFCLMVFGGCAVSAYAKNEVVASPKDPGAYVKTAKGYIRLLPNIVHEEEGIFFVEANNPPHFMLKDVQHFVLAGRHDMTVLTLNPMGFMQAPGVGKPRFIFGQEVFLDVKLQGKDTYILKPKSLLGRGYYSLWINDTAWDFILD